MHATVSLFVALSVVIVTQATPYYLPQQRQLFYSVVPQYPQYYPRQVYYAPPSAANLVAPVPAALRYPLAPPPAKSVVYYGAPALAPYPGNLVYAGADEGAEGEGGNFGGFWSGISSIFNGWISPPASGAEEGTAAEGSAPATPEKIEQASNSEQPSNEAESSDKEKENEAAKPEQPAKAQKVKVAPKVTPQKYVVVGQPQFFGNFGYQRVNPAAVLPSADHGAVSSYLLLKNYPGVRFAPQVPVVPQIPQVPQAADAADAELIPAGQPGAAALGYQKLLQEAAARQQKGYDDSSVTVDAAGLTKDAPLDDKPAAENEEAETEKTEDEETGTSE